MSKSLRDVQFAMTMIVKVANVVDKMEKDLEIMQDAMINSYSLIQVIHKHCFPDLYDADGKLIEPIVEKKEPIPDCNCGENLQEHICDKFKSILGGN